MNTADAYVSKIQGSHPMHPPTQPQLDFIKVLQKERLWFDLEIHGRTEEEKDRLMEQDLSAYIAGCEVQLARASWRRGIFTKRFATHLILVLKKCDMITVPAGRYALPSRDGALAFYVVDRSGRIRLQISDALYSIEAKVASQILIKIAADPLTASITYGREFGQCGVCGRGLTNAESREAGIGPVCAGRLSA